jgi:hypothetical protein
MAVVLAPLTMAEEPARRGLRGGQGRGNFHGRPGGFGGLPGMGQDDIGRFILGRVGDRLELTEEQRTEIKGIFEDSKQDRQASRTAVQEGMKALHEATEDGTEAEIIAAGKELGDALTNQALQKSATMKAVKAGRTPWQTRQRSQTRSWRTTTAPSSGRRISKKQPPSLAPLKILQRGFFISTHQLFQTPLKYDPANLEVLFGH